jgi:four helix bundle protein
LRHDLARCDRGTQVASPTDMPPWDLLERTRRFAVDVLKFCRRLPATDEAREAGRQLRRAANSTRSNYRAARRSHSRAAFRAKLQIAFEEADECVDWLAYLQDGQIQEDAALLQEAKELASILATAVRTAHRSVKST